MLTKLHSVHDSQLFTYHTVRGIQPYVNKVVQSALPTTHVIVNYLLYHTVRGIQPYVNKVAQSTLPTTNSKMLLLYNFHINENDINFKQLTW